MDSYFLIYLWTKLAILPKVFCFFFFITLCICGIFTYYYKDEDWFYYNTKMNRDQAKEAAEEFKQQFIKKVKSSKALIFSIIMTVLLGIAVIILPNKQDALVIYFTPKVYNSGGVQNTIKLLNELPEDIRLYIKKYIGMIEEKEKD